MSAGPKAWEPADRYRGRTSYRGERDRPYGGALEGGIADSDRNRLGGVRGPLNQRGEQIKVVTVGIVRGNGDQRCLKALAHKCLVVDRGKCRQKRVEIARPSQHTGKRRPDRRGLRPRNRRNKIIGPNLILDATPEI